MNTLVFLIFGVVAIAASSPAQDSYDLKKSHDPSTPTEPIAIVSQLSEVNPDGSYVNKFETANGISISEEGSTKIEGKDVVQIAKGSSAYSAPDGTLIETQWYADETGYHASGSHLPIGPEIPAYISKSLEWSAAHPYEDEKEKDEEKQHVEKL